MRRFGQFVDDLERFRVRVASTLPGSVPLFLLGHSLGGLIVLRYLQTVPDASVRGAILSAPALSLAVRPPAWKTALAGPLSRVLPALPFRSELDPLLLSRDERILRALRGDPAVHRRITPRLYTEMLASAREAAGAPEALAGIPLLFLIPGDDRIVESDATLRFTRRVPGDVSVRVFPGSYHECLNELDRDEVVDEVRGWIGAHVA